MKELLIRFNIDEEDPDEITGSNTIITVIGSMDDDEKENIMASVIDLYIKDKENEGTLPIILEADQEELKTKRSGCFDFNFIPNKTGWNISRLEEERTKRLLSLISSKI